MERRVGAHRAMTCWGCRAEVGLMSVVDAIISERHCGQVHCGISCSPCPPLEGLARDFNLRDDPSAFQEIDEQSARTLAWLILHRDLAYGVEPGACVHLANEFLDHFGGSSARYFTNGLVPRSCEPGMTGSESGTGWTPVTAATFDTGVLVISPLCSGCLWVEDED